MHTGYNNYWMYHANRVEPLVSLPVSENYGSQNTWAYTAYSYPSWPSYINNFHYPERSDRLNQGMVTSQSRTTMNYSVQNENANTQNVGGDDESQKKKTAAKRTPRISVKNVTTLNSTIIQNSDTRNSQQENRQYSVIQRLNPSCVWNHNNPAECMGCDKTSVPHSNQHATVYEARVPEPTTLSNLRNSEIRRSQQESQQYNIAQRINPARAWNPNNPAEYRGCEKTNLPESNVHPPVYDSRVPEQTNLNNLRNSETRRSQPESQQQYIVQRINHSRVWNRNNPAEYVGCEKSNLPESTQYPTGYEHRAPEQANVSNLRNYLEGFNQNSQYPAENQCQFSNNTYNANNATTNNAINASSANNAQRNTDSNMYSRISQMVWVKTFLEMQSQNSNGEKTSNPNDKVKIARKRNITKPRPKKKDSNSDSITSTNTPHSEQNEGFIQEKSTTNDAPNIQNHAQDSLTDVNQPTESMIQSSACLNLRKSRNDRQIGSVDNLPNQISLQENVAQITIPHTGQRTFVSLSDPTSQNSSLSCLLNFNNNAHSKELEISKRMGSNNTQRSERLSLPTLLPDPAEDTNPVPSIPPKNCDQNKTKETDQSKSRKNPSASDASSHLNKSTGDSNRLKNQSNILPRPSCPSDKSHENRISTSQPNISTSEKVPQSKSNSNNSRIKEEPIEDEILIVQDNQNISQGEVLNRNTEVERNSEENVVILEERQNLPQTKNSNPPKESLPTRSDVTKNTGSTQKDSAQNSNPSQEDSPPSANPTESIDLTIDDSPQDDSPEKIDLTIDDSPQNIDSPQSDSPENIDLTQDDSSENIDFSQEDFPDNIDFVQDDFPENIDFTQDDFLENIDFTEDESPESVDGTQDDPDVHVLSMKKAPPPTGPPKSTNNQTQKQDVPEKSATKNNSEKSQKDSVSEKNYKSEINRDKLDQLIQFLKKDEEKFEVKSDIVKKTDGIKTDLNHNRRKLSKTCIVKNRNDSREMIALKSHKRRGDISKTTVVVTNSNSNQSGEGKRSSIEEKTNSERIEKEKSNGLPVREQSQRKDNNQPRVVGEKSNKNTCETDSVSEYCDKEKYVIDTALTLLKFKTRFCRTCDLVLSIDSFWLNVVSGELKCLNCFTTKTLKFEKGISTNDLICDSELSSCRKETGEKNNSNSPNKDKSLSNVKLVETQTQTESIKDQSQNNKHNRDSGLNVLQKEKNLEEQKTQKSVEKFPKTQESTILKERQEDNSKQKLTESSDKSKQNRTTVNDVDNTKNSENPKQTKNQKEVSVVGTEKSDEDCRIIKTTTSNHSELISKSSTGQNSLKPVSSSPKTKLTYENLKKWIISKDVKSITADKSDKSHRKSVHKEKEISETHNKKEKHSQNQDTKQSNLEDNSPSKVTSSGKNTPKNTEERSLSVKNLDSIENSNCEKNEIPRKTSKLESGDKKKTRSLSEDGCTKQKRRSQEHKKQKKRHKENHSSQSPSHKNSKSSKNTDVDGHSRKRKHSDEYYSSHKIRIVEDDTKKDDQLEDKSKSHICKENRSSHKTKKEHKSSHIRSSYEKSKKHKSSKEQPDGSKEKSKSIKTCEKISHHSKHKRSDSRDSPRRKSQEENTSPKRRISKEEHKNEVKKLLESPTQPKTNTITPIKEQNFVKDSKDIDYFSEHKKRKRLELLSRIPKMTESYQSSNHRDNIRSYLCEDQLCRNEVAKRLENIRMKTLSQKNFISEDSVTHKKKEQWESEKESRNDIKIHNHHSCDDFDKKSKQHNPCSGDKNKDTCCLFSNVMMEFLSSTQFREPQKARILANLYKKTQKLS